MNSPIRTIAHLLQCLTLVLVPAWAAAQSNVSVNAKIDAKKIMVGDQAKLFIEATIFAKDIVVTWASLPDTFNSLEIVEKGKIDTVAEGAHITYRQRLLVTGFDSGRFTIPAFPFTATQPGAPPVTLYTDSFHLEVQTLPVDTTKPFQPIKSVIEVKTTWRDYLWWIIGAAVFLILAAFAVYYFLRHRKNPLPAIIPKAPPETITQRMLRELAALEQEELWQKNRVKEYYSSLTDILRNYLELRFGISAFEKTSDEILDQVRKHSEMTAYYNELKMILSTADLAKFAKAEPTPQEHVTSMEAARDFVKNTPPQINEPAIQSKS